MPGGQAQKRLRVLPVPSLIDSPCFSITHSRHQMSGRFFRRYPPRAPHHGSMDVTESGWGGSGFSSSIGISLQKRICFGRSWEVESYDAIHRDLASLARLLGSHRPVGAVSDWKGSIVAAVASHFGNILHQRCLAHVDRQAKRLLPLHSPFEATQALRRIASLDF